MIDVSPSGATNGRGFMDMNQRPPNILWICSDQQRYDTVGALGNSQIRTPHVDALIRYGVSFTRAYAQSPVCTPSRASFLTGRYPRTTRCRQNGQDIPPTEQLVTRILADAGYTCGLSGKLHLGSCANGRVEPRIDDGYTEFYWSHHPPPDWPENQYTQWLTSKGVSWDELYSGPEYHFVKEGIPAEYHQTTWCAERAVDFISRHRAANNDGPWLFSVNFFDPHHPFDPPAEYLKRYNPAEMPAPKFREGELDNKPRFQQLDHEWAHNTPGYFHTAGMTAEDRGYVTAAYWAMVELIDDAIGRMIEALRDTDQLDNTLVIFMSDHGEMLGDHGIYLKGPHFYEQLVRVPLVLRWPARCQRDLRADGLVELIDLAPTLLDAAGVPVPLAMQGRSLLPILSGEADPDHHRDHVFSEYYNSWTHKDAYSTMLRTSDSKIIVHHGSEPGELYDLASDPDEFDNLWNRSGAAGLKTEMLKRAFDASVFTMDPAPERVGEF